LAGPTWAALEAGTCDVSGAPTRRFDTTLDSMFDYVIRFLKICDLMLLFREIQYPDKFSTVNRIFLAFDYV